jgi:Lipocalin-like domain
LAWPAAAQDIASSIVGVWKITSFDGKYGVTGTTQQPFGAHPSGYIVYTRGGRFVYFFVGDNRKASSRPDPTGAERVELFKTLVGYSGTYKVEGSKVVMHLDASWHQSWTGIDQVRTVEISGNKMTLTSPPYKSALRTGQDVITIASFERVE